MPSGYASLTPVLWAVWPLEGDLDPVPLLAEFQAAPLSSVVNTEGGWSDEERARAWTAARGGPALAWQACVGVYSSLCLSVSWASAPFCVLTVTVLSLGGNLGREVGETV